MLVFILRFNLFLKCSVFFLFFHINQVLSETFHTFYGNIDVTEPVLLELIHSSAFQRLKSIHQYGVSYYIGTHTEEYNRFDHSIGVFVVLRKKGASLEEQVAGLLHDISHTTFSHVSDWVFKHYQEDDYHSFIHNFYLATSGIEKILNKYGFTIEQISPKNPKFKMLEQPLPDLCADRIDYNIQGAYFQNFITLEEAHAILQDLSFENGEWVLKNKDLALKLANFSLFMTKDCWGSALNHMASQYLAEAILRGLSIGLISWNEFHLGTDQKIWESLILSQDPFIKEKIDLLKNPKSHYNVVNSSEASIFVKFKCRGIDPWVNQKGKNQRLSSIDPIFRLAFQELKDFSKTGWPIKIFVSDKKAIGRE